MRFSRLYVSGMAVLVSTLTACGGGGAGSTTPPVSSMDPPPMNSAPGVPTLPTSSATMSPAAGSVQTSGAILGVGANGVLDLNANDVAGTVRIYTTSTTKVTGPRLYVGEHVDVTGTGSESTGIHATEIAQSSSATAPTPGPSSAPNSATMMAQTAGKIGLFQVFDAFGSGHEISASEALSDARRYGAVWGARPGMPQAWHDGNTALTATYYMPQETDASYVSWGGAGHTLTWWQANHPNWVLYQCTAGGTPTRNPAYVGNLPQNIPLDIHNPDVIDYQIRTAANYAISHGYQGLAFDEVLFYNVTGNQGGGYGCGIYNGSTFVRRYSGQRDANWTADTVAWVKAAHRLLTTDSSLAPHHLKLVVNHPAGAITDPNEQAILQNVDADLDETGFSDYGQYHNSPGLFKRTVDWMNYAQAHGASPLIVDKYVQSSEISTQQLDYSVATYLMGHDGSSGLFVGNTNGYGVENYHTQYAATIGVACGAYYGGSNGIYYRRFSGAVVAVNSATATEVATFPAGHTYHDLFGRSTAARMSIAPGDGFVMITTNGCAN